MITLIMWVAVICLQFVSVWASTSLQSVSEYKYTLPLYGSTSSSSSKMMMYYYMHLYVGSSHQPQSYIIDTTSSITTSPCKPFCVRCGKHRYDYYEIHDMSSIIPCNSNECSVLSSTTSTTSTTCNDYNQCSFDYVFSEGSMFSGVYVNEQIHFTLEEKNNNSSSSSSSTHIPIGCTSSESLSFYAQNENGIIGLSNSRTSFINTLYTKGIINQNIFSLCLSKTGNGYISIGSIDNAYHSKSSHSQISYIPLHNPTDPHYTLEITKLTLNNNSSISINNNNNNIAVIDSSSVISYIPTVYFDQIVNTLNEVICVNGKCGKYKLDSTLGICYAFDNSSHLDESVQSHWPMITFVFGKNVQYISKPLNYVYNNTITNGGNSNSNRYEACFGLVSTNDTVFTFGMNWMKGYDIIFDKGNKRVGFIEADCTRNNTFVRVGGDEESRIKWNEMLEIDSDDDDFEEEENEGKKVSKDDHNETVVNSDDDDDEMKDESISLINDNQSKVPYTKIYVFIGVCLFIIIIVGIVYCVFRLIYKNKRRNNMVRLEEEHESRTDNKHKPEIESEVEIVVQQQQQQGI